MMSVLEYAQDVNKSVEEIFKLCEKLQINVSSEDDLLSQDDITELDNELQNDEVNENIEVEESENDYDDDEFFEYVDLGFDREELIKQGYTKVTIYISIQIYGDHLGNRDSWVKPYNNKTGSAMAHYRTDTDDDEWEWYQHTFDAINITNSGFSDTLAFYMQYGAEGSGGDNWHIGDTTITVTAIK